MLLFKDKYYYYYFVSNLYLDTKEVFEQIEEKILEGEAKPVIPFVCFSGDNGRLANEAEYYGQSFARIYTMGPKDEEIRFSSLLRCKSKIGIPELEIKYNSLYNNNDEVLILLTQIIYSIRKAYVESFLNPTKTWLSEYPEVYRLRVLYEVIYIYLTLISTSRCEPGSHRCTLKSPEEKRKPDIYTLLSLAHRFMSEVRIRPNMNSKALIEKCGLSSTCDYSFGPYPAHHKIELDKTNELFSVGIERLRSLEIKAGSSFINWVSVFHHARKDGNISISWKNLEGTGVYVEGIVETQEKFDNFIEELREKGLEIDVHYFVDKEIIFSVANLENFEPKAESSIYFSDFFLTNYMMKGYDYWGWVLKYITEFSNSYNHLKDSLFSLSYDPKYNIGKENYIHYFLGRFSGDTVYDSSTLSMFGVGKRDFNKIKELAKNLSGSHNINLGINSAWNDDKITPIPRNRIVPEIKKLLGIDRLIIIIAVVFFLIGNKNQTMG